ncbi:MAG TPA: YceI family protein [Pseudonocardiaceae bacterium]|jgi:polyisoprenoid-binding protein YceI|nr:YceI family protein [Pseudonocardiaceae bacterium]
MTEPLAKELLTTATGVGRWQLDETASSVHFEHRSVWGLVNVKGVFAKFSGVGGIEPGGALTGTLRIDAASVDTKQGKRDEHLRSADFFDVERHPEITAEVNSATVTADGVELGVELTVRGTTQPLTVPATVTEAGDGAVTVTARTQVDRGRHGITWSPLGMMRGLATVRVTAVFRRVAD